MAPTKLKKVRKELSKTQKRQEPAYKTLDGDSDPSDDEEPIGKDETEERLEKLIFGDEAGFLDSLRTHDTGKELLRISGSESEASGQAEDQELADVADEDV